MDGVFHFVQVMDLHAWPFGQQLKHVGVPPQGVLADAVAEVAELIYEVQGPIAQDHKKARWQFDVIPLLGSSHV